MANEHYLDYIHSFRGVAIVGIVGIHCRVAFAWGGNFLDERLIQTIFDNSTILFVFIAGFLFEHLSSSFRYSNYLFKKLKYVILPYILVSIPTLVVKVFIEGQFDFSEIPWLLVTGKHFGPFWFIPMIALFYILSPLLRIVGNKKIYFYVLPLLLVFSLFTFRFGYYSNTLDSFIYFFPVYLLGMAVRHCSEIFTKNSGTVIIISILAYTILFCCEVLGLFPRPRLESFASVDQLPLLSFNIIKLKTYVLIFLISMIFFRFKNLNLKMFGLFADYSFGIYFVHLYYILISKFLILKLFGTIEFNILSFLFVLSFVIVSSMFTVYLVKLIFGKMSRVLIGS